MVEKQFNLGKGLAGLQKEIDDLIAKNEKAGKKICDEISKYGLKQAEKIYKDYRLRGNIPNTFYIDGTDLDKRIVMEGVQAVYDEFGTGTEGETHPHPIKSQFNLNDYNSGETIRPAKPKDVNAARAQGLNIPPGGLFWTYVDANGTIRYTQGTEAQREIYDSKMRAKAESPRIIRKVMKEVIND